MLPNINKRKSPTSTQKQVTIIEESMLSPRQIKQQKANKIYLDSLQPGEGGNPFGATLTKNQKQDLSMMSVKETKEKYGKLGPPSTLNGQEVKLSKKAPVNTQKRNEFED